jgi:hypothetical protein
MPKSQRRPDFRRVALRTILWLREARAANARLINQLRNCERQRDEYQRERDLALTRIKALEVDRESLRDRLLAATTPTPTPAPPPLTVLQG